MQPKLDAVFIDDRPRWIDAIHRRQPFGVNHDMGLRLRRVFEMLGLRRSVVISVIVVMGIFGAVFLLFRKEPRRPSLLDNLKSSPGVRIYPGAPQTGGGYSALVNVHRLSHPEMLALLRSAKKSRSTRPRAKPDCTFFFFVDGNPRYKYSYYGYVSITGELGSGTEWYVVPAKFKAWMLDLYRNRKPEEPLPSIRAHGLAPGVSPGRQLSVPPQPKRQKPKSKVERD
jgi:hypothetical protein